MDQDVVVQLLTRGLSLLAGAIALVVFATWFVGWLCRRSSVPAGWTALAQVLTPVALTYAASLYLDVAGQVVQARVGSTEERIAHHNSGHSTPGSWSRSFWATAEFETPEGPRMAPLWIDEATYDALEAGAPIAVRHLPWLPFIARPADQSTRSFVPWRWLAVGGFLLGIILLLRPVLRRLPAAMKALAILTALIVTVFWLVYPTPWVRPLASPVLTTDAEVIRVREETRSFTSNRSTGSVPAPQPWNVVELRFVPQGRKKAVIAVDSVDAGSVAGLRTGARLPVSYSANNPRDARLAGTRNWRWKEWMELVQWAFAAVVVFGGFWLLGKAVKPLWRRLITTQR
jgi:hypothetical protein